MAYKNLSNMEKEKTNDMAVIRILDKNGSQPQPEIQKHSKLSQKGLWKVLNRLERLGEIERIVLNGVYPVYQISHKSKILAEFNGKSFRAIFEKRMFENFGKLVYEFELSKHKKNKADALLQYLGFFVLGSLLASRQYTDKELRSNWLKPVLDLEKNHSMSYFLDQIISERTLVKITKSLLENYKMNMKVLGDTVKTTKQIKELTEREPKGLEWYFKDLNDRIN